MRRNKVKSVADKQMFSYQAHQKRYTDLTYSRMRKAMELMCTVLKVCSGPMTVGCLQG